MTDRVESVTLYTILHNKLAVPMQMARLLIGLPSGNGTKEDVLKTLLLKFGDLCLCPDDGCLWRHLQRTNIQAEMQDNTNSLANLTSTLNNYW
jgi:hypothetical protein